MLVSDSQGVTGRLPQEPDVLSAGLTTLRGDITQHRGHQGPQTGASLDKLVLSGLIHDESR